MKNLNDLAIEMARMSPQKRTAVMRIPTKGIPSDRGYKYIYWKDQYGQKCRLSLSSIATKDCIWLGVDEDCMHLDRKQAADLAALLNHFAARGDLP